MNPSHYPGLELCKKLTEIGFPITNQRWHEEKRNNPRPILMTCDINFGEEEYYDYGLAGDYVCPSVMEMLDVIPPDIYQGYGEEGDTYDFAIFKMEKKRYLVRYQIDDTETSEESYSETLPNALAEMILWLHKNNYISFSN